MLIKSDRTRELLIGINILKVNQLIINIKRIVNSWRNKMRKNNLFKALGDENLNNNR